MSAESGETGKRSIRQFNHFLWIVFLISAADGCYDHTPESSRIKAIGMELGGYAEAAKHLAKDCGEDKVIPSMLPEALLSSPGWPGWKGPYLDGRPFSTDPWGTMIKYTRSGVKLRIASAGPDGKFDTRDDVIVEVNLLE